MHKLKRVLLFKDDYPSLTIPFALNDFEVFWIESHDGFSIDIENIEQLIIEHKIEILTISHVRWLTGFTIDLNRLSGFCKTDDVLLILDGTQSLGAIPFSFRSSGVNILITSNYKWMNAGYGTGIMCIDEHAMTRYPAKIGGFNSYKHIDKAWKYHASISSYEPGHPNMAGLALLKSTIDYKMELGVANIANHNINLLNSLTEKIDATSYQIVGPTGNINRTSIVSIYGDKKLEKYLIDDGIIVKMRNGMIRIGMHFYNTMEDINQLLNVLDVHRYQS